MKLLGLMGAEEGAAGAAEAERAALAGAGDECERDGLVATPSKSHASP